MNEATPHEQLSFLYFRFLLPTKYKREEKREIVFPLDFTWTLASQLRSKVMHFKLLIFKVTTQDETASL